jgi:hypothetical protein
MSAFMKSEEDAISSINSTRMSKLSLRWWCVQHVQGNVIEVINGIKAKVVVLIFDRPTGQEDLLQLKKCTGE